MRSSTTGSKDTSRTFVQFKYSQSSVKFVYNSGQSAYEEQFEKIFMLLGARQCMHNASDKQCYKQWGGDLVCSVRD